MKRVLSTVLTTLAALCFATIASAIPATGNMPAAASEVTNQDPNQSQNLAEKAAQPPAKQAKKAKHHKKSHKSHKASKKSEAPASQAPAESSGTTGGSGTSSAPASK